MKKHEKKLKKKMKKHENKLKKTRKTAIFHFFENCNFPRFFFHFFFIFLSLFFHFFIFIFYHCFIIFHHLLSFFINSTTGSNNFIKKWEKLEENCNCPFLAKFLHHWKQKWWNMIKKWKNMKKNEKNEKNSRKIAIFHFLENCNFPRVFFSFFFYHVFFHVCIIF